LEHEHKMFVSKTSRQFVTVANNYLCGFNNS